jgi:hypothetical protein
MAVMVTQIGKIEREKIGQKIGKLNNYINFILTVNNINYLTYFGK